MSKSKTKRAREIVEQINTYLEQIQGLIWATYGCFINDDEISIYNNISLIKSFINTITYMLDALIELIEEEGSKDE